MRFFFFSLLVYFFLVKEGVVIQAANYGDKEKMLKKVGGERRKEEKGKRERKKKAPEQKDFGLVTHCPRLLTHLPFPDKNVRVWARRARQCRPSGSPADARCEHFVDSNPSFLMRFIPLRVFSVHH